MKTLKGLIRKRFKGSLENSNKFYVLIKRDNFPYFNIYELLRKGYVVGISLFLEILSVITTGERLILQIICLSYFGNSHLQYNYTKTKQIQCFGTNLQQFCNI